MQNVIISPHIDDAFLSLGGIIRQFQNRKIPYHILYVFTISNWVNKEALGDNELLEITTENVTKVRKGEEHAIREHYAHSYDFFDFLDHPLRPSDSLAPNGELFNVVKERIINSVSKEDNIYIPVALSHPDHILIKKIGLDLLLSGYNVILYEEMPYVAFLDSYMEQYFVSFEDHEFVPFQVVIDIEEKLKMLRLYSSQVSSTWLRDIKNYSYSILDNKYYERVWVTKGFQGRIF